MDDLYERAIAAMKTERERLALEHERRKREETREIAERLRDLNIVRFTDADIDDLPLRYFVEIEGLGEFYKPKGDWPKLTLLSPCANGCGEYIESDINRLADVGRYLTSDHISTKKCLNPRHGHNYCYTARTVDSDNE